MSIGSVKDAAYMTMSRHSEENYDFLADISETGPWAVGKWVTSEGEGITTTQVVLLSDDFQHDVSLIITGDFANMEQRIEYAKRLADRMNRMPKE